MMSISGPATNYFDAKTAKGAKTAKFFGRLRVSRGTGEELRLHVFVEAEAAGQEMRGKAVREKLALAVGVVVGRNDVLAREVVGAALEEREAGDIDAAADR